MLRALFIFIAGTLLFATLLTPVVYRVIEMVAQESPWPFSRVYDRVALAGGLILLLVLRRHLRPDEIRPYFRRSPENPWLRHSLVGALVALSASVMLIPVLLAGGEVVVDDRPWGEYFWKMSRMIPAAFLIAIIEESFFRVILLRRLCERFSFFIAAVLSSALYASVHFIAPVKSYAPEGFSPLTGFIYLGKVFQRLNSYDFLWPFFGLFLIGMVLCYAIHRSGSLGICLGLHAGWILAMKAVHYSVEFAPDFDVSPVIGRRLYLISKPMIWLSVLVVGCVVIYFLGKRRGEESA